jgi:hypothetical protein
MNNNPLQQNSDMDNSENNISRKNGNKISSPPSGYLTKSRYISLMSEQTIRDSWPKLSQRATPIIDAIVNQPIEFDYGKSNKKKKKFFLYLKFDFILKILILLLNKMVSNNMHHQPEMQLKSPIKIMIKYLT